MSQIKRRKVGKSQNESKDMQSYYDNPTLSDVTLSFSGREILAHRIILSIKSRWFKKAVEGHFKEASSGVINLQDDEPKSMELLIQHCYDIDLAEHLADLLSEDKTGKSIFLQLLHLYTAADKYEVPTLVDTVKHWFHDYRWVILGLSLVDLETLVVAMYDTALEPAHANRQNFIKRIVSHLPVLHHRHKSQLRRFLEDNPRLSADIALAQMEGLECEGHLDPDFPLHSVVCYDDTTQLRAMLTHRGRGYHDNGIDERNELGFSALHIAAQRGHCDIVKILVDEGHANVNVMDTRNGRTPLDWARRVQGPIAPVIRVLLELGAVE